MYCHLSTYFSMIIFSKFYTAISIPVQQKKKQLFRIFSNKSCVCSTNVFLSPGSAVWSYRDWFLQFYKCNFHSSHHQTTLWYWHTDWRNTRRDRTNQPERTTRSRLIIRITFDFISVECFKIFILIFIQHILFNIFPPPSSSHLLQ